MLFMSVQSFELGLGGIVSVVIGVVGEYGVVALVVALPDHAVNILS